MRYGMMTEYYCQRCKEYVSPVPGGFHHPHHGLSPAKVCPKCEHMVYLKEKRAVY